MRDAIDLVINEVRTEAATAEIAIWMLTVGVLAYTVALGAERWNRRRGDSTVTTVCGWGAVRVAALLLMFTLLAVQVRLSGWVTGADTATLDWFVAHRSPGVTAAAVVITDAASPVGVALVAVVTAALVSWRRRSWEPGVLVVGIVAVAAAASTIVKMIVARSRPPTASQLVTETDWSFPSGHVTGIVALAGALLIVTGAGLPGRARGALAGTLAVLVVVVVAATRLYLGVHWLTDVLGGALLGGAVVAAGSCAVTALAARRPPGRAAEVTGAPAVPISAVQISGIEDGRPSDTPPMPHPVADEHRPISTG
ncbi:MULTISPECIES: phosphatase PAP2 family protein [Rhodococcus]|nr:MULTISPECIES: phosphatase PAP2 family protein [Rhodococcus]EID81392.1 putative membrane protein [Rhodococcus opacus RKJ300 = JCM 13270]KAF0958981.1 hypothetical protein MLGJGCBP_07940 [Rhodococcus sp. T7]QQZ19184.1 phosphatase PAP2 family protein [Rhodococcus sp. 21391]UOT07952.1 phosphatase PAP2 family protein [Rhodococcus opacus]